MHHFIEASADPIPTSLRLIPCNFHTWPSKASSALLARRLFSPQGKNHSKTIQSTQARTSRASRSASRTLRPPRPPPTDEAAPSSALSCRRRTLSPRDTAPPPFAASPARPPPSDTLKRAKISTAVRLHGPCQAAKMDTGLVCVEGFCPCRRRHCSSSSGRNTPMDTTAIYALDRKMFRWRMGAYDDVFERWNKEIQILSGNEMGLTVSLRLYGLQRARCR